MKHQAKVAGAIVGLLLTGAAIEMYAEVPATRTSRASSARAAKAADASELTLQRGQPTTKIPDQFVPLKTSVKLKPVDFARIRAKLAKALSVAEASVPQPVPAQNISQPGNTVRIAFGTPLPPGATLNAWCLDALRQGVDQSGASTLVLEFNNSGAQNGMVATVAFTVPASANATYLLTCTLVSGGGYANPWPRVGYSIHETAHDSAGQVIGVRGLTGEEAAVMGSSPSNLQTANDQGVFLIVYMTGNTVDTLHAGFHIPNTAISFGGCDLMRVK
jgi:hypothetical protein